MDLKMLLLPVLGAFIGWSTNALAIKLIFRPLRPIKVPFLNIKLQGVIPKRQSEIAANASELIEDQLISADDLTDLFDNEESKEKLVRFLVPALKKDFKKKLPPYVPERIRNVAANLFEDILVREMPSTVEKITTDFSIRLRYDLSLKDMTERKINSFDVSEIEKMILKLSAREFRLIKVLGAVIGFLIGVIQLVLMYFTNSI